jgi:hypothetical protein
MQRRTATGDSASLAPTAPLILLLSMLTDRVVLMTSSAREGVAVRAEVDRLLSLSSSLVLGGDVRPGR